MWFIVPLSFATATMFIAVAMVVDRGYGFATPAGFMGASGFFMAIAYLLVRRDARPLPPAAAPSPPVHARAYGGGYKEIVPTFMDRAAHEEYVRHALEGVAERRATITYKNLADMLEGVSHRSSYFHQVLLGELSASEHREGRPLLTSIVVKQNSGRPGAGFFRNAREIGAFEGPDDEEARERFWQAQVSSVYARWANHP